MISPAAKGASQNIQGRTEVHGKGVGRDLQKQKQNPSQNVAYHTSTSETTLENGKGSSHVVFMIQEDPSRRLAREGVRPREHSDRNDRRPHQSPNEARLQASVEPVEERQNNRCKENDEEGGEVGDDEFDRDVDSHPTGQGDEDRQDGEGGDGADRRWNKLRNDIPSLTRKYESAYFERRLATQRLFAKNGDNSQDEPRPSPAWSAYPAPRCSPSRPLGCPSG